eukprot:m.117729 g.117729  ORF g.117729 m.117729 type:complete len:55 (+) comp15551_c0_seq6:2315-2479(+)
MGSRLDTLAPHEFRSCPDCINVVISSIFDEVTNKCELDKVFICLDVGGTGLKMT